MPVMSLTPFPLLIFEVSKIFEKIAITELPKYFKRKLFRKKYVE